MHRFCHRRPSSCLWAPFSSWPSDLLPWKATPTELRDTSGTLDWWVLLIDETETTVCLDRLSIYYPPPTILMHLSTKNIFCILQAIQISHFWWIACFMLNYFCQCYKKHLKLEDGEWRHFIQLYSAPLCLYIHFIIYIIFLGLKYK